MSPLWHEACCCCCFRYIIGESLSCSHSALVIIGESLSSSHSGTYRSCLSLVIIGESLSSSHSGITVVVSALTWWCRSPYSGGLPSVPTTIATSTVISDRNQSSAPSSARVSSSMRESLRAMPAVGLTLACQKKHATCTALSTKSDPGWSPLRLLAYFFVLVRFDLVPCMFA